MIRSKTDREIEVTELELSTLENLCEKSNSSFVHFIDGKKQVISKYEKTSGRFIDLAKLSSLQEFSRNTNEIVAKKMLSVLGRIEEIITVAFDIRANGHILVFVVFSGNYRNYIDEFSEVELECHIMLKGYSLDFIPLSSFEFDRSRFSDNVIGFTRRSVGCPKDLNTSQK